MATVITATESNQYDVLSQVVDVATAPSYKWFSLQDNVLDGSFHPMDSSGTSQIGWWGTQLSGAGGALSNEAILNVTLASSNRCPNFSAWVLSGGAYLDTDGNLVLPAYGASAITNAIVVDFEAEWHFSAEYFGTTEKSGTPGQTGVLHGSAYYDVAAFPTTNSAGYTGNGNATSFPINQWTNRSTTGSWQYVGGPNVKYMTIQISTNSTYTGPDLKVRRPMLTTSTQGLRKYPFEGYDSGTISVTPQAMHTLRVIGDSLLNEYPVDFAVKLFNQGTEVFTQSIVGNAANEWKYNLPSTLDANVMEVRVTKVNKVSRSVKLLEASNVFEIIRADTVLVSSNLNEASTETISFTRTDELKVKTQDAEKYGLYLDGTNTMTVTNPLSAQAPSTQQWCVEAKVKIPSGNPAALRYFAEGINLGLAIEWSTTNNMLLYLNSGVNDYYTYGPNIKDDKVHNIAFTFRNSDGTRQIVIDGVDSSTGGPNNTSTPSGMSGTLTFGNGLIGYVYDIRIWNIYRTPSQIATQMNTDLIGNETGLVGYWPLNEGDGTIGRNLVSGGSNLTINGADWISEVPDSSVTNSFTRTDTLLPNLADASFFTQYEIWRNDTLLPKVDESDTITVSFTRTDTLTPNISESDEITVSFTRTDILTPKTDEATGNVTANITSADILLPKIADVSTPVTANLTRTDTLTPKIDETDEITVSFTRTDILTPKIDETKAITASFSKADTLSVASNIEADFITAQLFTSDILNVVTPDTSDPTNIYTVMDADERQTFCKVEITYTSPFNDETINYTATNTGQYTDVTNLADAVETPAYKWFSLHDNKLDGTFHPMPVDNSLSTGWWGTQLSDGSGNISSPPVITVTFSARAITSLKVIGDSMLNNYPVDFVIKIYNASNTVLLTRTVTGNTFVNWTEILDPFVPNAVKMDITISKVNKPNQVAKLMEFFTAIVETYYNEDVQSLHLLEEIGYKTGSLPIGNVSANEIDITLANTDRRFDLNNTQSRLYGNVKRNRRVRAWLGAYIGETLDWYPLGTFWTTQWDIPRDSMFATLTARDRLELLRNTNFIGTEVLTNKTLYWLFETILQDAGLVVGEYDLDASLSSVVVPYAWFDRMKHRDALSRLSGIGVVQVYCTKDGIIRVNLDLDSTPTVIMQYDDDTNVINAKFPLAIKEEVNHIEVTAQQWEVGASENLFESTDVLTVPGSQTITRVFQFQSVPVVSISSVNITAGAGVTVAGYTTYSWGAEISFTNSTGSPVNITAITVVGTKLVKATAQVFTARDEVLIQQDGEIRQTVSHDFIQDFTYAQNLANTILATFKTSRNDVTLAARGNPAVRLNDKATYENIEYTIVRQTIDWDGTLSATTEGKKL